jgi:tetratricopeptide (TPR) repeat protein
MTIIYGLPDLLFLMQQSIKKGDQAGYSLSARSSLMLLILIFCSGLLFLPASGYPISAYISTEPPPGAHMSAADYESQGISLMNRGDWNGLLSFTSEGLEIYPDNAELHCLLGYGLRMTGRYPEAVDAITFAIARDPKPIRYANRGFAYLAMGKHDDALADAETAIAMNGSYPRSYAVKTMALSATGNLTGAGQAVDTALTLDPSDPLFWHLKGRISAGLGDCTGALDAFNRSIAINPDYVLPWPGFGNATTGYQQEASRCTPANTTPAPTKAALPAGCILASLLFAMIARRSV